MLRRWYVALPILLATGYLAATSSGTVSKTYSASTSMIMLGPSRDTFTDDKGVSQTVAVNPYLNLPGTATTIATTLALKVSSNSVRQEVAKAGLSPGYGVSVGKTPVMDVTVETDSEDLALATVKYVAERLKTELQSAQDEFGVGAINRLNLKTFVPPDTLPTTTASTVMRVRMTVVGFGLVLAVAVALAFEGLAEVRRNRTRKRRKSGSDPDPRDDARDAIGSAGLSTGTPVNPGS